MALWRVYNVNNTTLRFTRFSFLFGIWIIWIIIIKKQARYTYYVKRNIEIVEPERPDLTRGGIIIHFSFFCIVVCCRGIAWESVDCGLVLHKTMSMDDTQKKVQDHLKNKCRVAAMSVPRAWIDGCVAFYRNSNSNTNLTDLLEFVTQQWFLVDFESIKLRSLPVNLQKSALVTLEENYIVQVFITVSPIK